MDSIVEVVQIAANFTSLPTRLGHLYVEEAAHRDPRGNEIGLLITKSWVSFSKPVEDQTSMWR